MQKINEQTRWDASTRLEYKISRYDRYFSVIGTLVIHNKGFIN